MTARRVRLAMSSTARTVVVGISHQDRTPASAPGIRVSGVGSRLAGPLREISRDRPSPSVAGTVPRRPRARPGRSSCDTRSASLSIVHSARERHGRLGPSHLELRLAAGRRATPGRSSRPRRRRRSGCASPARARSASSSNVLPALADVMRVSASCVTDHRTPSPGSSSRCLVGRRGWAAAAPGVRSIGRRAVEHRQLERRRRPVDRERDGLGRRPRVRPVGAGEIEPHARDPARTSTRWPRSRAPRRPARRACSADGCSRDSRCVRFNMPRATSDEVPSGKTSQSFADRYATGALDVTRTRTRACPRISSSRSSGSHV